MTLIRPFLLLATMIWLLMLPGVAFAAEAAVTPDGVDPDPVEAAIGEVVTIVNDSDDTIRLIDDDGRWDSGDLAPSDRFSISFDTPGTYSFTSEDGRFSGTIEVIDPDAVDEDEADAPDEDIDADADDADADEEQDEATGLADTGLPSASLAWTAALMTMVGVALLARSSRTIRR